MKLDTKIDVHHLTRVEGHGNIHIRFKGGKLEEARWEVVETPRFFEVLLRDKHWESLPIVTGRICGICSVGHTLASIRAIENAFGFTPGEQTRRLRLLLKHMETLQSHSLHVFFLVLPDFMGAPSVLPLTVSHPELVQLAAEVKLLANDMCDIVGGRRLHPTRTVVGGFTMLPTKEQLVSCRKRLMDAASKLDAAVGVFAGLRMPEFTRETEYVSLAPNGDGYPFIGGELISSDGVRRPEGDYRAMTNEYTVAQSTSKWARLSRESFAVGALARFNNNGALLHARAQVAASRLGLVAPCHNPFMNNAAQLVECVHVAHDSMDLIDALLDGPMGEPKEHVEQKEGSGVGAVEVPRGILYHYYDFDAEGRLRGCDCVIPTGQNHANIQHDLTALAGRYGPTMSDSELELLASMLVRAYDPCISCSVH